TVRRNRLPFLKDALASNRGLCDQWGFSRVRGSYGFAGIAAVVPRAELRVRVRRPPGVGLSTDHRAAVGLRTAAAWVAIVCRGGGSVPRLHRSVHYHAQHAARTTHR